MCDGRCQWLFTPWLALLMNSELEKNLKIIVAEITDIESSRLSVSVADKALANVLMHLQCKTSVWFQKLNTMPVPNI
jgi:hypothetical protein